MPIVSNNFHAKSEVSTKELLRFHSGCHIMTISLVLNRNVVSAARDLVPTSKKTFTFYRLKCHWVNVTI